MMQNPWVHGFINVRQNTVGGVCSLAFTIVSAVCLVGATVWLCCMKNNDVETDKKAGAKTFFLFASVGIAVCFLSWMGVLLG